MWLESIWKPTLMNSTFFNASLIIRLIMWAAHLGGNTVGRCWNTISIAATIHLALSVIALITLISQESKLFSTSNTHVEIDSALLSGNKKLCKNTGFEGSLEKNNKIVKCLWWDTGFFQPSSTIDGHSPRCLSIKSLLISTVIFLNSFEHHDDWWRTDQSFWKWWDLQRIEEVEYGDYMRVLK